MPMGKKEKKMRKSNFQQNVFNKLLIKNIN